MHTAADFELLRRYADHGSDEAFTELVRRHINLVWSAAHRLSGNAELAKDVSQLVFTDLARKARTLPSETVIAGWLHRAACLAAAKQIRGEIRRSQRERIAMTPITTPSAGPDESQAVGELQPVLDEALAELPETDRNAVVLRFLAGRSLAEVGAALGTGEDAAQKRVSRALEKLRESFRRRGLDVSGGMVVAALGFAGAQAAPLALAGPVAAGALAAAGTASGTAAIVLLMKTKLTVGIVGGAALVAVFAWQQHRLQRLAEENSALRGQLVAAALPVPSATVAQTFDSESLTRQREQQEELLRLRGEVSQLRQAVRETRTRSEPVRDGGTSPGVEAQATAMLAAEAVSVRIVDAQRHLALAVRMYFEDHQQRLPTKLEELHAYLKDTLGADGTVKGVSLDLLEFHDHDREVAGFEPRLILMRERHARRLPDGIWERIYSLMDGSVQRVKRANGDFSDFELAGTATVANAPTPR
jgi:RNA polymerase sigma factor (sigma-70 family)